MFGASNPFGQSSNSPFGTTQPVFGQTSNVSNSPFAPKPFGSPTTPFGAQTGSSIFGGTSTGMFGTPQTSFTATSAFGSSMPAFGASTTPAFGGSSSSAFGAGSSVFGQKPFGGFGSTTQTSPFGNTNQQPGFGSTPQTSPFGNTNQQPQPGFGSTPQTSLFGNTNQQPQPGFGNTNQQSQPVFGNTNQQSQPAFGNNSLFGSTPFGVPTQSAFSSTSTPAFGTTTAPTFGSTSTTSAFGSTSTTPAFGAPSTTPAFGSTATPAFGSTGAAFTSSPLFGAGGAFGTSTTSVFGSSATTPAFGNLTGSGFGTPTTSAFGATSSPSFTFSSSPGFGQSTSAFGSSPFGNAASTFPAQPSPFGAQPTTSAFGNTGFAQPGFGGQRPGTRAAPYAETAEAEGGAQAGKLLSISAMPAYKDKSHEELRWEDYQLGDKGGQLPSPAGAGYSMSTPQVNPFAPSTGLGQTSANIFSSTSTNLFGPKTQTSTPSFTSASPFGPSTSSNLFQPSTTPAFSVGSSPSLFGSTSMPNFSTTPSLFSSSTGQGNASPFGSNMFNNTQSSLSFPSTTPSMGQTTAFPQSNPFGASTTSSLFSSPATGSLFSSTQSQITPNLGGFNQMTPSQPAQNAGLFALNFSQPQAAGNSGFAGVSNNFGQSYTPQNAIAVQPVPATNPFGTLPAMPQVSFGRAGTTPPVQYGISTMPVVEKPSPVRISSLLPYRHLSHRRIRLPMRKYYPKHDGPKVPFFSDEEEIPSTPKADALFIPRENPRALVIRPMDQWPSRASADNASALVNENGKFPEISDENGVIKEQAPQVEVNQKPNGVHDSNATEKEESYKTISGHRAGEAAIVYEHGADIEALMPKLRSSDYYTEPRIQELAAKERAKPGFCRHVKDFVVGRHGYGSIKFLVETDVRRLDLESLVQFNNREVIVYMDDSKKPPVGQGLNKPAEVTLLNIKCVDKKTGRQFTEGPKIERYKEMLRRKAEEQGAEFVSYDPVKGEWKFKVNHFSKYMLEDEEEEDWTGNEVDDCLVLKD